MIWRLLGSNSYFFFTFDRLIQLAVKTIQTLVIESPNVEHLKLFAKYVRSPTIWEEQQYMKSYRKSLVSFGVTNTSSVRLHFNPSNMILTVHYFHLHTSNVHDRKTSKQMENFYQKFSELPGSENLQTGSELEIPTSQVFLKWNMKKATNEISSEDVVENSLTYTISSKHLKLKFGAQGTDAFIRKRVKLTE